MIIWSLFKLPVSFYSLKPLRSLPWTPDHCIQLSSQNLSTPQTHREYNYGHPPPQTSSTSAVFRLSLNPHHSLLAVTNRMKKHRERGSWRGERWLCCPLRHQGYGCQGAAVSVWLGCGKESGRRHGLLTFWKSQPFPRSPSARSPLQAQASHLEDCRWGCNDLRGQRRKEGKKGSSWLSKREGDNQLRGNWEAGSKSSVDLGLGGKGLGTRIRGTLFCVFMRFAEERLSYPAPHSWLWMCEFPLPALIWERQAEGTINDKGKTNDNKKR